MIGRKFLLQITFSRTNSSKGGLFYLKFYSHLKPSNRLHYAVLDKTTKFISNNTLYHLSKTWSWIGLQVTLSHLVCSTRHVHTVNLVLSPVLVWTVLCPQCLHREPSTTCVIVHPWFNSNMPTMWFKSISLAKLRYLFYLILELTELGKDLPLLWYYISQ